jgi:hypothetical protein
MRGAISKIGRCWHFQPPESNRESLRLETHVTHRKQTTSHRSNRENKACFSDHHQPTRLPTLIISNRESLRLETHLTRRKQTAGHHSNRENKACFSDHHQPTRPPILKISNRESIRLEIHLAQRNRVRAIPRPPVAQALLPVSAPGEPTQSTSASAQTYHLPKTQKRAPPTLHFRFD